MKKRILAWLLFHANKSKDKRFYDIKNRILKKYGKPIGFDIQHIEGKRCFSCGGTGTHTYFNYFGEEVGHDACWKCNATGWFRRPVWNYLYKIQFGKYVFHQPYEKTYSKPEGTIPVLTGYIEHDKTKYTEFALFLLFLAFEKGYLKHRYYQQYRDFKSFVYYKKKYMFSPYFKLRDLFVKRKFQPSNNNYSTNDDLPF